MSQYGLRSLQEEFQKLGFVGDKEKKTTDGTKPVGQVEDAWIAKPDAKLEESDDSDESDDENDDDLDEEETGDSDDASDDQLDEATRKIVTSTGEVQKVQVARGAEKMKRKKQARKGRGKRKRRAKTGAAKRAKKILKRKASRGSTKKKRARIHKASADAHDPVTSPITEPQGADRLDTLLSQLESMAVKTKSPKKVAEIETKVEGDEKGNGKPEAKKLDENTARLMRIYGNVAAIADEMTGRLDESDELHGTFDTLATDALELAEGLRDGKVDFETAKAEVKNYVKDLVSSMQTIEEEFEGGLEEMKDEDEDEDECDESEDEESEDEEEEDEDE